MNDGHNCGDGCGGNVLLASFTGVEPSVNLTGSTPERSTWAMGLIGFGAMAGFAAFNRRKARFAAA
jgi:hypothetical protein